MRGFMVCALIVALFAAIAASSLQASTKACARPSSYQLYTKLPREYPQFYRALRLLWGVKWVEAATVSYGEGSWHSFASNGQFRTTFQMGSSERRTYGDGPTLWEQAIAAHNYYVASGSDWSPWECKP